MALAIGWRFGPIKAGSLIRKTHHPYSIYMVIEHIRPCIMKVFWLQRCQAVILNVSDFDPTMTGWDFGFDEVKIVGRGTEDDWKDYTGE